MISCGVVIHDMHYRNATEDLREADSTDDEVSQINTRAEIKKELEKINAIKENGKLLIMLSLVSRGRITSLFQLKNIFYLLYYRHHHYVALTRIIKGGE